MKILVNVIPIFFAFTMFGNVQNNDIFSNPPDSIPKIFAKGIVSVQDRYEYGLAISPNYDEIFFTASNPGDGLMIIRKSGDGNWKSLEIANLRGDNNCEQEAFYTPDGQKLYFASDVNDITQLWVSIKENSKWSFPKLVGSPVNDTRIFWATFTNENTMYYSNLADFKIYRSEQINGKYPTTEFSGIPFGMHPYISKDESFILFNYRGDIYISFKNKENGWIVPIKFDGAINTSDFAETCPSLSPDEKYIFYSRYNDLNDKSDIVG